MRSANRPMPLVRAALLKDAPAIAEIYAPIVRDTSISFEIDPPDAELMAERIRGGSATHPWLVAELDGMVVGYAYASRFRDRPAYRWSVEVSAYVSESMRGRGIGRSLHQALLEILQRQGFRSAFAGIALPNPASVAMHEAVGFTLLGVYREVGFKHGRWHDVGWWRRGLSEALAIPAEPIPFASLSSRGL